MSISVEIKNFSKKERNAFNFELKFPDDLVLQIRKDAVFILSARDLMQKMACCIISRPLLLV